jgi:hypothetical protein
VNEEAIAHWGAVAPNEKLKIARKCGLIVSTISPGAVKINLL